MRETVYERDIREFIATLDEHDLRRLEMVPIERFLAGTFMTHKREGCLVGWALGISPGAGVVFSSRQEGTKIQNATASFDRWFNLAPRECYAFVRRCVEEGLTRLAPKEPAGRDLCEREVATV